MDFLIALIFVIQFLSIVTAQACVKSSTVVSGVPTKKGSICVGDLVFEENFDKLDLNLWGHEETVSGGGNNEFQWYTNSRSNSYASGGHLHIRPTLTAEKYGEAFLTTGTINLGDKCTERYNNGCFRQGNSEVILPPVISAKLKSKLNFKYGRLVVRAKIPSGDWLWPAIWLMPAKSVYGYAGESGEMDVMESRGNSDYVTAAEGQVGAQQVAASLHYGGAGNNLVSIGKYRNLANGYDKAFHDYELVWTSEYIRFLVDGSVLNEIKIPANGLWRNPKIPKDLQEKWKKGQKDAPFDQEFYLIINTAVGGTRYFSETFTNRNGRKPWNDSEGPRAFTSFWRGRQQWLPTWDNRPGGKSEFLVDYVRLYAV